VGGELVSHNGKVDEVRFPLASYEKSIESVGIDSVPQLVCPGAINDCKDDILSALSYAYVTIGLEELGEPVHPALIELM
jgi:hypothetical protein